MIKTLADALLRLLFPDRCAGCKRIGALLCITCRTALQPYPGGDKPIAELDGLAVAHLFAGALRPAIHLLKYRGARRVAEPLSELLTLHLRTHPLPADAIAPVPLHPKRLAERGFNQAELLARAPAHALNVPLLTTGLVRVRSTEQQARQQNAHDRRENMRAAFVWQGKQPPPARVLLIDDVLTTGATIAACAEALRVAGAREVRALALARSRPKRVTSDK